MLPKEQGATAELRQAARERRHERIRNLRARHAAPDDGIVRKMMGDVTLRTAEAEAPQGLVLFGDDRDQHLIDTLGMVIGIGRRERRAELDAALAERVEPQLRKLAALELKLAELTGAVDVLRCKEPPPHAHLEIERETLHRALGEVLATERTNFGDQLERKTSELKIKLAELTGAVDVLSGKQPPPPAKFPSVKVWKEGDIYHEGDVVAFAGSTYQATKDTVRAPGSRDWTCLAIAGVGFTIRGTHDANEEYKHLDVVMVNGSSFVALKDSPGPCPGGDWHLLASRGSRGSRGMSGERGPQGPVGAHGQAAPAICAWELDRVRYVATPIMTDGTRGPPLELRGLFEQFLSEVGE